MKKYHIKQLCIETTRRCNYSCIHCCKGDAQNLTITPEIIDTMFSQLSQVDHVALLGGEPLLELDILEYLLVAIDRYRLNTRRLSFVTNGSILDHRVLQIFNQFMSKKTDRKIDVRISNDQFHDNKQSEKALLFYTSANQDVRIKFEAPNDQYTTLVNYGRVQDLSFQELETLGIVLHDTEDCVRNHQICIEKDTVQCIIQLSANGNIGFQNSFDYDTIDTTAFDNILNNSLENIFTNHNKICYVLCDEAYNEMVLNDAHKYKEALNAKEEEQRLYSLLRSRRLEVVWTLRAVVQELQPDLDIRAIIRQFPPVSIQNWDAVCGLILGEDIGVERAKAVYKTEFKEKHPDATNETIEHLSLMKYMLDLLDRTKLVTLLNTLGKICGFGRFYSLPVDFCVCDKIPDSLESLRKYREGYV